MLQTFFKTQTNWKLMRTGFSETFSVWKIFKRETGLMWCFIMKRSAYNKILLWQLCREQAATSQQQSQIKQFYVVICCGKNQPVTFLSQTNSSLAQKLLKLQILYEPCNKNQVAWFQAILKNYISSTTHTEAEKTQALSMLLFVIIAFMARRRRRRAHKWVANKQKGVNAG